MSLDLRQLRETYERAGYVFPLEVMAADEAAAFRRALERVEGDYAGDPDFAKVMRNHPHLGGENPHDEGSVSEGLVRRAPQACLLTR